MNFLRNLLFAVGLLLLSGCWLAPKKIDISDERLKPLFAAISQVDRASMGFTAIPKNADIRLESSKAAYDVMLHIYGRTSRTIAFKKVDSHFEWIGEQETHTGSRKYTTVDGTFNEEIVINYDLSPVSGFPIGKTVIVYHGDDPKLSDRDLTLDYVQPIISAWDTQKPEQGAAANP